MATKEFATRIQALGCDYIDAPVSGGQAGAEANKVPVYQGTANSIANLGTNTTNGITQQNNQAANAELAGSGNLWGLGLNLAKLGVGALSGGTSLLGGK